MTSKDQASSAKKHTIDYASEVRFGVVLYGGVSLAIYINGVANEMYEMVCATPRGGPDNRSAKGTREIYHRLAWLVDNPDLREEYCRRIKSRPRRYDGQPPQDVWEDSMRAVQHPGMRPTRLVVDVISGTSAGGINGIFLAKALTNGKQFEPLQDLWVQEGDITSLLNDSRSYSDLKIDKRRTVAGVPPKSLLNSDRMFLKLFDAMTDMNSEGGAGSGEASGTPTDGLELIDELDLFITTTDIVGSPVPLRLSGQVVYERRHKQNFHFSYSQGAGRNDFTPANDIVLAFAARCTSSFPFAFEPMTMEAAERLKPSACAAVKENWHKFLSYLPPAEVEAKMHVKRAFGDGGYLDNKPFTYVANTLSTRQATVPVERKLIYVEPDPETLDADDVSTHTNPPDALANSLAALAVIPRYETIREDLQEVLRRNRSIERVDRIMREGETDLHNMLKGEANPFVRILKESHGEIPPWPEFDREKMARFYGTAFLAYRRMRVSSVTDELAYCVAKRWGIDFNSDHLYALTALLREWRNLHFQEEEDAKGKQEDGQQGRPKTINAFLDKFDVRYRIRKLSFLLRQIDHLMRLLHRRQVGVLTPQELQLLSEADRRTIEHLKDAGLPLQEPKLPPDALNRAIDALKTLKGQLNDVQGRWRIKEHARREPGEDKKPISDQLREELKAVLSLLLGEREIVMLTTNSGRIVPIDLPEETRKASACARTMQDSVLRRTKDLLERLRKSSVEGRTIVYGALKSDIIDSMALSRNDLGGPNERGTWEILGKPQLKLEQDLEPSGKQEKVKVHVDTVDAKNLDNTEATLLRRVLGEYYIYFDLFDQMSFPLFHDAGIGEPATVEVVRISPIDATNLINEKTDKRRRRKLAGTALANFGAFIHERWRRNDIMWGRLDGAERLIQAVLPMTDGSTQVIRKELVEQAHRIILQETLKNEGAGKVTKWMCEAISELSGKHNLPQRVRDLFKGISPGSSERHEDMESVLTSLINEQALIQYVRTAHDIDRTIDPKETFTNASRAVTITGRMLDEISKRYGQESFTFRWLSRFGMMCQGLIAVSVPGGLVALWRAHIMTIVYVFEICLLIATILLRSGVGFAWKLLVVTGAIHFLIYVTGDLIRAQNSLFRKGLVCSFAIILPLAGVGGKMLYDWSKSCLQDVGQCPKVVTRYLPAQLKTSKQ